MPSFFAITPVNHAIKLDPQRRGAFVFTVTNTTGHPIIARARINPQNPSEQSWFNIKDGPQRTYPMDNITEQIEVRIEAPASARSGSYSFHLDVISVEDPDEVFTIGPSVSFEIPPTETGRKTLPWWIIGLSIALLLMSATGTWFIMHRKHSVDTNNCKPGYVWRLASPEDHVCVTPEVRAQTREENAMADKRKQPGGGRYGPDTCLFGFVWREAFAGDRVCVSGESRAQAARDNQQARSRILDSP